MPGTRDQQIDEMLDLEAIKDLPARYCHYVWTNNHEGVLNLFTDDGVFASGGAGPAHEIKGKAELRRFYASEPDRVGARPFIHNIVIELKGPTRAIGYAYMELRSAAQQMKWLGTGYYEDEYEKVAGHWKFKSRRFNMVHSEM